MKLSPKFISGFLKTVVYILLFTYAYGSNAQDYRYTLYNTENSDLPQNQITALFQDSKGNLWVGTKFGAARYDGKNFKLYNTKDGLLAGDISGIFETSKSDIFICGMYVGISIISGDSISTFPIPKQYHSMYHIQKGGSLFIIAKSLSGNNHDILVFKDKNYKKLATFAFHLLNMQFANDTLWATMANKNQDKFYFGYFDDSWKFHNKRTGSLYFGIKAEKDSLYFYTEGLYRYYRGKLKQLGNTNSRHLFFTDKWIYFTKGQDLDIVMESDYSGNLTDSFYMPGLRIMLEDKEKNLWIGTEHGLYNLQNKAFRHYLYRDYGISENNPQLSVFNNELWISTLDGHLYRFKNNKIIDYKKYLPSNETRMIIGHLVKPDGIILWGLQSSKDLKSGLLIRKGNRFTTAAKGYSGIYSMYYDSTEHKLLCGNDKGLIVLDDGYRLIDEIDSIKNLFYITGIEKDTAGYYWFSSRRAVYRYKNKKVEYIDLPLLKSGALQIIHDSKHNLWFGGEGGLIFYNNNYFKQIKHGALKDKAITTLHEVGDSVLLIGTTSGLASMDLKSFYSSGKTIMKFYNAHNGFSGFECMQSGFVEDNKGIVWIAVNDRFISIDPRKLNFDNVQVSPYISAMWNVKNDVWQIRDTSINELNYDEDRIKFEFSGPYFSNPVSYSYYLKGYDENWSDYGIAQEAIYSHLPKGKYTFYVKASNGNELDRILKASYSFTIKPAFWGTFWFYALIFLSIFAISYLIIRQQIRKKTRKQRRYYEQNKLMMQTQMAQLDPHFIFNTLTTTGSFALSLKQIGIYDIIVRFSKLLRTHWNNKSLTRTLDEELEFIKEYCALNRINHGERFDYSVIIADNVDTSVKVLKLSIQNFVENAIKYGIESISGKGLIQIKVEQDEIYTKISLEDNGIGYKKSIKKSTHRSRTGIKTIRRTFDLYNSWNKYKLAFEIIDKSEIKAETSGTIVKLSVPNNYKYSPA